MLIHHSSRKVEMMLLAKQNSQFQNPEQMDHSYQTNWATNQHPFPEQQKREFLPEINMIVITIK